MIEPDQASTNKVSPDRLRLLRSAWRSVVSKIDPARSRLTHRTRALYWLNGTTHSLLHALQKKSYADELAAVVPPAPIFVIGFWRSGTTFLHELLCRDPRFGFPSTYACLNPSHFLLSERWMRERENREVARPMDNLRYSWSSPQEDEFALLALGAPSAYEALLVPSRMRNVDSLLDWSALSAEEQDQWFETFHYFLKLLTIQQQKPMVLKSPTHGYRMGLLAREFPSARYVIIERNPYEVFASNLKLWRTLTDRYGLEHCPDEDLEQFILAAYLLHEKAVSRDLPQSKPGAAFRLRYEDLEKDPIKAISHLYDALELGQFEEVRPRLEEYVKKVSGHVRNRFRLSRSQKAKIDDAWGDLIEERNYVWPNDYIGLD